MQNRWIVKLLTMATALGLLTTALAPPALMAQAQGRRRGDPHTRRPNAPPTPRLADGKPNLGSTTPGKGAWIMHEHESYNEFIADPKEGIPYQPWARALRDYRSLTISKDDPQGFCLPPGGPRKMMTPSGMEFLQQPDLQRIVMLYEGGSHRWQMVYMDGRPHPPDVYDFPSWTGHAIGRWEGDTLMVDTVGFNEGHWLDKSGSPRTHLNHVTERFRRLDYSTLEHEATVDDPGAYTRPWTVKHVVQFDPELQLRDMVCQENNRFMERFQNLKLEGEK